MASKEVIRLDNSGIKKWKCNKCGRIQDNNMVCAKCGGDIDAFDEITMQIAKDDYQTFEVIDNIIYENKHIEKGTIIELAIADPNLPSLMERKLIKRVKEK